MQAVLYLVPELRHHCSRYVSRALCHEEDGNAFRSYELHNLLNLFEQALRRILEEQVRLIEEEHHLRLFRVAHFRQHLEELRQQVEHEGRIESRLVYERLRVEYIDYPPAVRRCKEKVSYVYRRLAEKHIRAL